MKSPSLLLPVWLHPHGGKMSHKRPTMAPIAHMVRWAIISGCFGFVLWGWINSFGKYLQAKTAIRYNNKWVFH